jgi:glycosyltransferase involved in cell wall biosynthesis
METVVNAVTGFLCAPTPDAFAVALAHIVRMFVAHDRTMNVAAKAHVSKHFSFDAFARQMNNIVCNL